MAKYRNVSVKFWSDQWVADNLTPEKRYFFLYLITNEHTSQCGIYGITIRQMAFETGYNQETIENLLQYFQDKGKIIWSKETSEIAIKNFIRYNPQGSPKVKSFVEKELLEVKNQELVKYLYPIDNVSQEEKEIKQEKNNKTATWPSFNDFWQLYAKKVDRPLAERKWDKIPNEIKKKIMEHVPIYVKSTPDIQFRKNPSTYLNQKSWENEIVVSNGIKHVIQQQTKSSSLAIDNLARFDKEPE